MNMATRHSHHGHQASGKNLLITVILNLVITLTEFLGGIFSNSLALISDALHNLGDTFSIVISYIALRTGRRKSNAQKTFGYKRIEILAALFNTTLLIGISLFLFFEAYHRLKDPVPIKSGVMFWVALVGLMANLFSILLLKRDSKSNLNVRSAYLHLMGDTLSSVAVILGSILIRYFEVYWIDPLLTFLIGIFIIRETWSIWKETIEILMEASPGEMDIGEIRTELEKHPRVSNIHHIHAWSLTDSEIHFQCHVDILENLPIREIDKVRMELEKVLTEKFGISHVTIQVEFDTCDDKGSIAGGEK
jgi:cobalt-zinc-cadmium efflux system protein